jgi:cytoskeletal protein CcmA (bactofilin family)
MVVGATIEADSAVEGIYVTSGNLKVDGLVKGEIVCRGMLVVSDLGEVRGSVEASEIVLAGRLEGDVVCQGGFVVLPTGWLSGKVSAAEVSIQDGAYYAGELHLHNQRSEESSPRSEALMALLERRKGGGLSLADFANGTAEIESPALVPSELATASAEASTDDAHKDSELYEVAEEKEDESETSRETNATYATR